MSILTGILTVVLLFCHLSVDSLLADTVERTFPAAEIMEVVVDGGSIELIGSETGLIKLEAESDKDIEKHYVISSELDNGVLRINIKHKNNGFKLFSFFGGPSISLSLTVPFQTACTLRTSGGSIEACSLDADLEVRTSGGSINCNNVRGQVTLKTSGGSIKLERVAGVVDAHTSGGSIKAVDLTGDGRLHTSGGKINLNRCNGAMVLKTSGGSITVDAHSGSLDAKTSAGSVSASFVSPPEGDCLLKTSAGSIKLVLPGHSSVSLDAETSAGSVHCDLAMSGETEVHRSHLRGNIGQGGPKVRLKTAAGSIRIVAAN